MLGQNAWDLAAVTTKWLLLLAMAGVIGGSFSRMLAQSVGFPEQTVLRRYVLVSAVLGLVAVPLFLLVQTGGVNQTGWSGMFDQDMASILLQSEMGEALRLRMIAFALAVAAPGIVFPLASCTVICRWSGLVATVAATGLLGCSFALTGHVSALSFAARSVLVMHVLAALVWAGALFPLLQLSRSPELARVQHLMRNFGGLAVVMVTALLLAGVFLASQLLSTPSDLWTTGYGRTLMLKLSGVSVLLLLAATNKLLLVPHLLAAGRVDRLRESIKAELVVAVLVLAITVWLTTLTGPAGIES